MRIIPKSSSLKERVIVVRTNKVIDNIVNEVGRLFGGLSVKDDGNGFYSVYPEGWTRMGAAKFYEDNKEKYEKLWWGLYKYGFKPKIPDFITWYGGPEWSVFLVGRFKDGLKITLCGDFLSIVDIEEYERSKKL